MVLNYPNKKMVITDFKRNNKIGIRNFTDASDFHDLVKLLLVKILRRKHQDNNATQIYTEYSPTSPLGEFPDIWMSLRERNKTKIVVYEIQKEITKYWTERVQNRYENCDLIIVPLKEVLKEWKDNINSDPIKALRQVIEPYVV